MSALGEAALERATAGWRVFPVHGIREGLPRDLSCTCVPAGVECSKGKPGKHPRIAAWQTQATTDRGQISQWWSQWPDANIGVATGVESDIFVVDIDGDEGLAAVELYEAGSVGSWDTQEDFYKYEKSDPHFNDYMPVGRPPRDGRSMEEKERDSVGYFTRGRGALGPTARVRTGRGLHLYFQQPADDRGVVPTRAGWLESVDVRGEGGYVLLPPSRHVSGNTYEWVDDERDPAPPPLREGWFGEQGETLTLADDIRKRDTKSKKTSSKSGSAATVSWTADDDGEILDGSRNAQLTAIAGYMRRGNLSIDEIDGALQQVNQRRCRPPLDEAEVRGIAESVGRYKAGYLSPIVPDQHRELRLYSPNDILQLPDTEWLVEGIVPEKSFGRVWGKPGVGKSFVILDIAAHIAHGKKWWTREVKKGRVVYAALEGFAGYKQRLQAWQIKHEVEFGDDGLQFINNFDFRDPDFAARLIALVRPLEPALLVVDTLSRSMPGADENSQSDMSLVVRGAEALRDALGCAVLVVHHANKTGQLPRGSTVVDGALDWDACVHGDMPSVCFTVTKQKDGETEDLALGLETVELPSVGGKWRSSLVVTDGLANLPMANYGLADLIVAYVRDNPAAPTSSIRDAVKGRKQLVVAELTKLVDDGRLVMTKGPRNANCYTLVAVD